LKLELLRVAMQPDTFKPYPGHSFQLHLTLLRAESRGEVAIASASASDKPRIIFNYLAAAADREAFRSAIRLVREIVAQPAFSDLRDVELAPGSAIKSDDALDAYVASRVATAYHPASTCKMGASDDDAAVVTPDLRVRGLAGLRVADASIMPVVVSSNTNAPTIMIGEKAADLIRGRTLPPEPLPYYVAPAWERSQR
jgi:choline dehydrogenase